MSKRGGPPPKSPALARVPPAEVEAYVRHRLAAFAAPLVRLFDPKASQERIDAALQAVLQQLPREDDAAPSELQLVFRHACRSQGCDEPSCELCMHNPARRCTSSFASKYLCEDILRPRCEAELEVALVDPATGRVVEQDMEVEACVLNGAAYEEARAEAPAVDWRPDCARFAVVLNKEEGPLLVPRAGGASDPNTHYVVFKLKAGVAPLPEMFITASSEALLSGRKPPFRLWVRPGSPADRSYVLGAVSEPFVVATKRVRTAGKVETPCINDDVSKLKHMGKETVKKLGDLAGAAEAAGIRLPKALPVNSVTKVRDFLHLARACESDPQLVMNLQSLLKLNRGRWHEACEHAATAVHPDGRLRVYYADNSMDMGLLFACRLGNVDLDRPLGLLMRPRGAPLEAASVALTAAQTPAQRDAAHSLRHRALDAWWRPGHPGWAIHPADSDVLASTGELQAASGDFAPAEAPVRCGVDRGHSNLASGGAGVHSAGGTRTDSGANPSSARSCSAGRRHGGGGSHEQLATASSLRRSGGSGGGGGDAAGPSPHASAATPGMVTRACSSRVQQQQQPSGGAARACSPHGAAARPPWPSPWALGRQPAADELSPALTLDRGSHDSLIAQAQALLNSSAHARHGGGGAACAGELPAARADSLGLSLPLLLKQRGPLRVASGAVLPQAPVLQRGGAMPPSCSSAFDALALGCSQPMAMYGGGACSRAEDSLFASPMSTVSETLAMPFPASTAPLLPGTAAAVGELPLPPSLPSGPLPLAGGLFSGGSLTLPDDLLPLVADDAALLLPEQPSLNALLDAMAGGDDGCGLLDAAMPPAKRQRM